MFERYTEKARRTIFFARYEAIQCGSPYIESEHLLLGLLREDSALFTAITNLDLNEDTLRQQIVAAHPAGKVLPKDTDVPLSNECKRILAYTAEESVLLGDRYIGTEHLLLGILRDDGSFAAKLLRQCGADLTTIRKTFANGIPANPGPSGPAPQPFRAMLDQARKKMAALRIGPTPGPLSRAGFHKFSEKARRVIFFARYEARQLGAPAIEPEHLLLGVTREMASAYSAFLPALRIAEAIRENARKGIEATSTSSDIPISARTKQVLSAAQEEAARCGTERVRPEHLLFGIASEEESFAARTLRDQGVDIAQIYQAIDDTASKRDPSRS
jgi:ATP-dependent Clp protease ATP-binding subunit ClpA